MSLFNISDWLQRVKFSSLEDAQLAALIAQGNQNAFSVIYERYKLDAYNYSLSILKNKQAAMDATHDCFIKLFEKRKSYKEEMKFKSYFFRVIRNHCFDILKKKGEILFDEREDLEFSKGDDNVFDDAFRSMTLSEIDERFYSLEVYERDLFILWAKGFSMKEISNIAQMKESNIKTKLHRIKKKLTKDLDVL